MKGEENYCAIANALGNAFEETAAGSLSTGTANSTTALNGCHSADADASRFDDADRVRKARARSDFDGGHLRPPMKSCRKVFSGQSHQSPSDMSAVLVARRIDLDTLNSDYPDHGRGERAATDFDYRFRYGLSSLEICSKYSSGKSELAGLLQESENHSAYDERVTYQTSTAAAFFAR